MKIYRLIIIFIVILLIAFILQLLVYKTSFTYAHISNSLFVVGLILFLPCLAMVTRAYEVFQGFSYAIRVLVSPAYRDRYPRFRDYKSDHDGKIKTGIFFEVLASSFIVIVVAGILAGVA